LPLAFGQIPGAVKFVGYVSNQPQFALRGLILPFELSCMNVSRRALVPLITLISTAWLPACTLPRMLRVAQSGQQVQPHPPVLEANGDQVLGELTIKVPAAHLH
jgi:hypothetical protein